MLFSLRSEASKLTRDHSMGSFSSCKVVSDSFVFVPLKFSLSKRLLEQNDVFEPESRNAYISTILP